jgi:hypothetical protein
MEGVLYLPLLFHNQNHIKWIINLVVSQKCILARCENYEIKRIRRAHGECSRFYFCGRNQAMCLAHKGGVMYCHEH